MRALLLAAGLGQRLRPVTDFVPKCLVPIHGIPLLQYWLTCLQSAGVTEVLVNLHYQHELVREFLGSRRFSGNLEAVFEPDLLGTAGTLNKNREFFAGDSILLVHADNLTLFDLQEFHTAHRQRPKDAVMTMMTFDCEDPKTCGIVELNANNLVVKFHEKVPNPPGRRANAAVYILEPEVLEFISGLNRSVVDFSTEVIPHFMGKIATFHNTRYHRDIGNLGSFFAAQLDFPRQALELIDLPSSLIQRYAQMAQSVQLLSKS